MLNYLDAIRQLNDWTKAYDEGHSEVSDGEWDKLYFEVLEYERTHPNEINKNSPTQSIQYEVKNELFKVRHDYAPMLSLAKTKSVYEVANFIGSHKWIAMAKLDGLSCRIEYRNHIIYRAETRGDGIRGEDITHNILTISNVPKYIESESLVVDGEIICKEDVFEENFSTEYQNPRNFAAGSIRLLDANECKKRQLSFIAWDIIDIPNHFDTLSSKLMNLQKLGFMTCPFIAGRNNNTNIVDTIKDIVNLCDNLPIDGIVFKWDNCEEYRNAGRTDHHYRAGLSYKFADEEYETYLTGIEWTMGRSGILTPVACVKQVEINETIVSRASLHNVSIMKELLDKPYMNQPVSIIKSNMIIPQIVSAQPAVDDNVHYLEIPQICPYCGQPVILDLSESNVINLKCTNLACNGKLINRLDHYLGKKGLEVKGISKATLEKLIDWGWLSDIKGIYILFRHKCDWIKKPGFGETSVEKIFKAIDDSRNNVQLNKFISALGIPLIGGVAAKQLADEFKTWDNFIEAADAGDSYPFLKIKGFGYEMARAILSFDYSEAKSIVRNCINFAEIEDIVINNSGATGKTFVITGKLNSGSRDAVKKKIEAAGGKVASAVSSKTDYLVNNDANSTTAKNMKAKELNIPIITEDELLSLL